MKLRCTDSKGNKAIAVIGGKYEDDIFIEEVEYEDLDLGEVSEQEIEYIQSKYQDAMYESWYERQIAKVDFLKEDY